MSVTSLAFGRAPIKISLYNGWAERGVQFTSIHLRIAWIARLCRRIRYVKVGFTKPGAGVVDVKAVSKGVWIEVLDGFEGFAFEDKIFNYTHVLLSIV